jgi:hypothetical protein
MKVRIDTIRITPEPTDDERRAILAALAAATAPDGRNLPAPFAVEEPCAVAVETIQPGLPTSPSAPSA